MDSGKERRWRKLQKDEEGQKKGGGSETNRKGRKKRKKRERRKKKSTRFCVNVNTLSQFTFKIMCLIIAGEGIL